MKTMLTNRSLLTGLMIMTSATYAQAAISAPLVFGATYVSAGAEAEFGGDIVATTYFVGGAVTGVTGNILAGTAITLGATSTSLSTSSGTATTLGAGVVVSGNANYGTALTLGASASSGESTNGPQIMSYASSQVTTARGGFSNLDADPLAPAINLDWVTNHLISTMDVDTTLAPQSGNDYHGVDGYGMEQGTKVLLLDGTVVYNLASLTTGADVTLTLTCGLDYVFNIADMLSLGAGSKIEMSDINGEACFTSNSVTWNLGGYASAGEDTVMIGDVLANGYISTGVNSTMNGKLHSETSYVTIGASGTANNPEVPINP
jgi:hypothetical protein